jgi:hypothetical protein
VARHTLTQIGLSKIATAYLEVGSRANCCLFSPKSSGQFELTIPSAAAIGVGDVCVDVTGLNKSFSQETQ